MGFESQATGEILCSLGESEKVRVYSKITQICFMILKWCGKKHLDIGSIFLGYLIVNWKLEAISLVFFPNIIRLSEEALRPKSRFQWPKWAGETPLGSCPVTTRSGRFTCGAQLGKSFMWSNNHPQPKPRFRGSKKVKNGMNKTARCSFLGGNLWGECWWECRWYEGTRFTAGMREQGEKQGGKQGETGGIWQMVLLLWWFFCYWSCAIFQ